MIFPCLRCGCMPPGPTTLERSGRSTVCPCPPDRLNQWWDRNADTFKVARNRERLGQIRGAA